MKVSILTLHEANNVGAFLQAFSLQNVVETIEGVEQVEFVRFPIYASKNSKLQKVLCYLKQRKIRLILFKYKTSIKYRNIMHELHLDERVFSEARKYDTVIVGSDEVWNLASNNFTHHHQYFAKAIFAKNICSYAASANNTDVCIIRSEGMDFKNFKSLSVRDDNTWDLVKRVDGREAEIVCDPTLLIENFDEYIGPIEEKDYILVYSYDLDKNSIADIKKFAKKNGKKLISVGTYNAWCDKNIVVDPFEFLSWLLGASQVVTSTFHGTVLSIKLHKNVAVYAQTSHKVKFFLKQMGLEERDVSVVKDLECVFGKKIDYVAVEEKIREVRVKSMNYLRKALEVKE